MQKFYPDRIFKKLANLPLAILLLLTIGFVVALGTVIEQDQTLVFYQQNYPETKPALGFLNWKILVLFNLDHIYTSYWFLTLLFAFGTSLMACTFTIQLPVLRRLRRWQFYNNIKKVDGIKNILPIKASNKVVYQLHTSQYNIFRQGKKNYAYAGLLGRFGPIVVHASIILLLIGSTLGSFQGYMAQEIIPRGELFHTQNLIKLGNLSTIPQNITWRVNDFWITYTKEFKTNQFYSDISLIDDSGSELKRKTIFVNEPFVYNGLTVYQTDWDIVGMKLLRNGEKVTQLSLKKVTKSGQKFWFGSIVADSLSTPPQTFSILVNDLRGNIYLYNSSGNLVQECQLGQPVLLTSNENVIVLDFLTSTGLQIKADPGIRTVYLAFFLLMVSTYVSFVSYSQIWGVEINDQIYLVGKSNRAVLLFQAEFRKLVNKTLG